MAVDQGKLNQAFDLLHEMGYEAAPGERKIGTLRDLYVQYLNEWEDRAGADYEAQNEAATDDQVVNSIIRKLG